ncbi:MAG TPA: DMT family transporter, partial [Ilumatobacteraceae bacterium]|nr:DMT family transporter [Ilumatobacteraceae bacterium]
MQIPPSVDINKARVAVAALLFGTSGVAAQLLAPGLPAVTTAGWRVVLGGAVLVGLSAARGQAPWRYPRRWRVTATGAVAFLVFQLGFFLSVSLAGAATATIVTIGTGPVVAGLLDGIDLAAPRLRVRKRRRGAGCARRGADEHSQHLRRLLNREPGPQVGTG